MSEFESWCERFISKWATGSFMVNFQNGGKGWLLKSETRILPEGSAWSVLSFTMERSDHLSIILMITIVVIMRGFAFLKT